MRDHHQRAAALVDRVAQQREHVAARPGVQRAGRLVGEDHVGLPDERAGDRDALLLAARELRGTVAGAVAEPDALERAAHDVARDSRLPARRAGSATFCSAVSAPSRLKDWKTNPISSRRRRASAFSPSAPRSCSPSAHVAARRPIEPRGDLQQRRLARAGRAHDRRERAGRQRERDAVERADGALAAPEHADDLAGARRWHAWIAAAVATLALMGAPMVRMVDPACGSAPRPARELPGGVTPGAPPYRQAGAAPVRGWGRPVAPALGPTPDDDAPAPPPGP